MGAAGVREKANVLPSDSDDCHPVHDAIMGCTLDKQRQMGNLARSGILGLIGFPMQEKLPLRLTAIFHALQASIACCRTSPRQHAACLTHVCLFAASPQGQHFWHAALRAPAQPPAALPPTAAEPATSRCASWLPGTPAFCTCCVMHCCCLPVT